MFLNIFKRDILTITKQNIRLSKASLKYLARLPPPTARRLLLAIENIASGSARAAGVKKLKGRTESRLRIGHHRVIYEWRVEGTILLVLKIGPRGDVYK